MRGGSHFVMNAVSAFALIDGYLLLTKTAAAPSLKPAIETAVTWMSEFDGMSFPVGFVLSMLGYLGGSLMPDVDSPHSPFGRYVHVNVAHRTWTHSLWFVLLFAIPSYWFRPLIWLALGTFFHIFWDSFSV
ncbi:MAG: metal-dependent hydrolase, partial [Clostridia bacterium]|nr:metal-dependent hydrolase [Clostridia bacterium]